MLAIETVHGVLSDSMQHILALPQALTTFPSGAIDNQYQH